MPAVPDVAFLHTSPVHVATFSSLVAALAPGLTANHEVREDLLTLARELGPDHPEVVSRTRAAMLAASRAGASVVVCTCSSVGGAAEGTDTGGRFAAMRVDRAMADAAVASGGTVLVAAALESTLEPTEALLKSSAARARRDVTIRTVVAPGAWALFEAGRDAEYFDSIARAARACLPGPRVVVLAQASMQGAVARLADLGVPVLASPALGVQAVVDVLARDPRRRDPRR